MLSPNCGVRSYLRSWVPQPTEHPARVALTIQTVTTHPLHPHHPLHLQARTVMEVEGVETEAIPVEGVEGEEGVQVLGGLMAEAIREATLGVEVRGLVLTLATPRVKPNGTMVLVVLLGWRN